MAQTKAGGAWEQAEAQAGLGQVPVLHITGNYRPILTITSIETYMNMRKTIIDLESQVEELKNESSN